MDDINVYTDLQDVDLGNQIAKLQENNNALLDHIHELEGDISKLCGEVTSMKSVQENLTRNISELYNTAKVELQRKDRLIADLRSELDDLLFRRTERNENVKRVRCQDQPDMDNKRQKVDKIECRKSASIERKSVDKMHHDRKSDRSRNRGGERHQSNYRNKRDDYIRERHSRGRHRSRRRSRSVEARKHNRNKTSDSRERNVVDKFKNSGNSRRENDIKQEVGAANDRVLDDSRFRSSDRHNSNVNPYDDSYFRTNDRSNFDVKPYDDSYCRTNDRSNSDVKPYDGSCFRTTSDVKPFQTYTGNNLMLKTEEIHLDTKHLMLKTEEVNHDTKTNVAVNVKVENDLEAVKKDTGETLRNEPKIEFCETMYSQRRKHQMTLFNDSSAQLQKVGDALNFDVKKLPCEAADGSKEDKTVVKLEVKEEHNCDLNGTKQDSVSLDGGNLTGGGIKTLCNTSVPRRPVKRRRCVIQIKD